MGCSHAQNHINGAPVAVAAIAPEHQCAALNSRQCAEHRLNEAFQVVRFFELFAAFAKAGCAWLLIGERNVKSDQVLGRVHGGRGGHHKGLFDEIT